MPYELKLNQFSTEEEAVALATAAGQFPMAFDFDAVHNDFHWHNFEAMLYVVSGEITITERDTGDACTLTSGSTIRATTPQLVHKEDTEGYRAVLGFLSDPAEIKQPIDRDPALLA